MISTDNYTITEKHNVKLLEFNHIAQTKIFPHGFSTRIGGVSPKPYDTMNLGFTTQDNKEHLDENRKRFHKALGIPDIPFRQIISLVHKNQIVNHEHIPENTIPEADGVITDKINIPLVTTHADCIPIFLADPQKKAFGVIHAGWRSTFQNIAAEAVKQLKEQFNCKPRDILAGIGPGIARCCFEVDKNVTDAFNDRFFYWKDLIEEISNTSKWRIDLHRLNERILVKAGIHKNNIAVADLCTACRGDLFFSYRRDGKKSGRMAAVMVRTHFKVGG